MTQIIDLGKLRFSFAGDWVSSTVYESNDIVKYGGNVYVYTYGLKTSTHLPTDTVYWALMVEGFKFQGVYDVNADYKIGNGVAYGGKVYICVADTTGDIPPNLTYWSQFADGIQYEGDYSAVSAYQRNDLVKYGSSAYIAILDTTGNLPTDITYWAKLVEGVSAAGAWSAVTAYVPNDLVAYGANQYKAIANVTGIEPASASGTVNSAYWALQTEGIRTRGDWTTATEYFINDVVTHGGNSYITLTRHASAVFDTDLAASMWRKFNSGIRWRGAWASAVSYLTGDIVKDAVGSAYIATADHTSAGAFITDAAVWDQFVVGGSDVLPAIAAGDIGRSLAVQANGAAIDWIGATESANVFYVAPHGVDVATSGKNISTPFASVRYACDNAPAGSTIYVRNGTYNEQLPITIPSNTAVVGDNQRTVVIQPAAGLSDDGITPNNEASMFLMSDGSILNKMTFKGMTGWVPGSTPADITTSTIKGVVVRLNPASPITHKSPYVLECSFIGSGAIGALIDGNVHATGAKTMIFHGYTVISDNGVGYWVKDGGKSEIVSCFTYYAYFGYTASGGGFIRALNGNNSYGTWGATARGFSAAETAITGTIVGEQLPFTYGGGLITVGDTVSNGAGATATVTNVQYSADKVYIKDRTGTFTGADALTFSSGGTGTALGAAEDQRGFVLVGSGFSSLPKPGASISLADDTYAYVIQSTTGTWVDANSDIVLLLSQEKPTGSAAATAITIRYKYSQIRLTGHDFLSIGTGGTATTNYPGEPTQPSAQGNETDESFPGRVFYVSTDQDGNFRVGEYFKIDQATGTATLNANAFNLSGLSSLRLGSIGAQLGESINEFSSDGTLSGNSNLAVPTEYAVRTFVTNLNDTTLQYVQSVAGDLNSVLADVYSFDINPNTAFSDVPFRAAFTSGGGTFTWSIVGSAPTNMVISAQGVLGTGGAPIAVGAYTFNVRAVSGSVSKDRQITINSDLAVPVFNVGVFPATLAPNTAFSITAAQATAGGNAIDYAVSAGSLPPGHSLSASTGTISGTAPAQSATPVVYSFTISASAGGFTTTKSFSGQFYYVIIQGQALYGTNYGVGTFSWVAPLGVETVSVVAVGGGANGPKSYNSSASGGSGAGLGWKNNIPVVPGQTYTVFVGNKGTNHSYSSSGLNGSASYFISTATVCGKGGNHFSTGVTSGPNQNGYGGGYVGDGGGAGGNTSSNYQAGSGAGGYTGKGADTNSNNAAGGGAGSGGQYSSTYGYSSGGGVGLLGQGSNGPSMASPWQPSGGSYGAGLPGSWNGPGSGVPSFYSTDYTSNAAALTQAGGGCRGMYGENPWSSSGEDGNSGLQGGTYGGGGGGQGDGWPGSGGPGGQGGVRIIWGPGRAFPATSTLDVTPSGF